MNFSQLEHAFNRALKHTFSKRKLLFTIPVLLLCGLIIVFFRTLGAGVNDWMQISMGFLPFFLSLALLLGAGVILTRIYHHEVKQLPVSYRRTFELSRAVLVEVGYLAVPVILSYLLLWTVMGFFFLLRAIPGVGVVLSFGPFLLLLGSLALSALCVCTLFFVAPAIALRPESRFEAARYVLQRVKQNPFGNLVLLLIGLIPLIIVGGIMSLSAVVTATSYASAESILGIGTQWFCIMIPFSALLTPAIIFFFNFAAECHALMVKRA
ncbi:MAG: hypothetical protein JSS61_06315 [Verrucomicrobia bacterium]|nr:hypothetical protein [Verrucomicrobiota bacterium]